MSVLLFSCCLLGLGYTILMLLYRRGWAMQHDFVLPADYTPQTKISIIIPARNEEHNIGACIASILQGQYPKELFEVIVVDDHSTDGTAAIVNSFTDENVKCISLAEYVVTNEKVIAFKKKAITAGIANSSGTLIVTTDADCRVPTEWLLNIAAVYESENAVMIAGPVNFTCDKSIVQQFQSIDFMSMQGITIAAHQLKMGTMCNGANLAFSRDAYDKVNGYNGIEHIASGDDYLLMVKMQKTFPGRIAYLKSDKAIVNTAPQPTWSDFFQQRIRWASKSGKYGDTKLTAILAFVYIFNFAFLVLVIGGVFNSQLWQAAFWMLLLKIIVELYYLWPVSRFFHKTRQLVLFPLLQPLHILYIIAAGFLGFAGVYKWKGRRVH